MFFFLRKDYTVIHDTPIRVPTEGEAKDTFLVALQRPVKNAMTTQAMKGETTDMVIEWTLQLELEDEDGHRFGKCCPKTRNIDFARQFNVQSA